MTSPSATSSPHRLIAWPTGAGWLIATRSVPPSVHSTGTTASAPAGSSAPVMTRALVPGASVRVRVSPAGIWPVTGRTTGAPAAAATSLARTA